MGSWVPEHPPPLSPGLKLYLRLGFFGFVSAFFPFSCVSSILNYNNGHFGFPSAGDPKTTVQMLNCLGFQGALTPRPPSRARTLHPTRSLGGPWTPA